MARSFLRLTRANMRALKPGQKIMEHGIIFERLSDKDGMFSVNFMVDRRRIHCRIGRESEGVTRTNAEDYIASTRSDARSGRLNLPQKKSAPVTFAVAAEQYIERLMQTDGKDVKRKRQRLDDYLVPFFGDLPLTAFSEFDIERYIKHRLGQTARTRKKASPGDAPRFNRPATVNLELATLSHLLAKALEWNWIQRSPCRIRKLKVENGRIVFLSVEQAEALLEAARHDQSRQIYALIFIGLRTGMRKSEILSIRRADIDFDKHAIYVPHAKAGPRTQPITADLASYLREYIATLPVGAEYIFPSPAARSGRTVDVRKAFVRVVMAAGLDPKLVVLHTLRHTAITHLVQAGVDLPTVKRISGHKTMIMVERYAHQSGSHITEAMNKLDARYARTKTA